MGGGSPPQQKPGDSPQQGGDKPSPREATPEAPKPGGEEEKPQDGDGDKPSSPRDSTREPENRLGSNPPPIETARVAGPQSNERWGDLPEHVRDLFRTEGTSDLPPRYRESIDSYYRRLNERP